ncbi:MAG: hypothetical protein P8Y71_21295 [Pseudolabrys sp.]
MTKSPGEFLAMQFSGVTVGENLERAIEAGTLIENNDGTLELAADRRNETIWMRVPHGPPLACDFLMYFMFDKAYGKSAVPHGCGECYKVKVVLRTLRQLVAAWEVAKRIECLSKWGLDLFNPHSQNIYAGYFYTTGLEGARVVFKIAREAFRAEPKLGRDIAMTIKRGCSEYEAAVGPSDRYEFTPEMAELEKFLKSRYRARKSAGKGNIALARWIDAAFRMGDDTYLDFTDGKRLRPKSVTYDP